MLDLKYIRKFNSEVTEKLATRNVKSSEVRTVLDLDDEYRSLLRRSEEIRAEKNAFTAAIATVNTAEKETKIKELSKLSVLEHDIKEKLTAVDRQRSRALRSLPNIPADNVPVGKDETQNIELRRSGAPAKLDFTPLDYMALAGKFNLIDTVRAAKVSGTRFGYLQGDGALLWLALLRFVLDKLRKEGFTLFFPPVLVKKEVMENCGYDSYIEGQEAYAVEKDNLFLVGTGEHALIPYHSGETLAEATLPKSYAAYSSCFRREAGSYGKDTKGIIRVHQFEKLEMVVVTDPKDSWKQFDRLLSIQESILRDLGIPYHVISVCTGDLPRPSAKVIDLECWIPSESRYRETHSVSNCTDYQARRNDIRIKGAHGTSFAHLLNATAVTPRTLIAIIENYQTREGTITVPEVLVRYFDGRTSIS